MQQSYSYPEDRYILVGTVTKPQGLHGEVCIYAHSGQPENFTAYKKLFLVDKKGELSPELTVTKFRFQKGKVIIRFDRVSDRTHAEHLAGMGVLVARENLPELAENEFYWHQIIGKNVHTVTGEKIGILRSVFSNGAQDVMVITNGDEEYLVPLVQGVFVEQRNNSVVIDPPPGLLDINSDWDEDGVDGHR